MASRVQGLPGAVNSSDRLLAKSESERVPDCSSGGQKLRGLRTRDSELTVAIEMSLSKLDIDETTSVYNNSLFGDNDLWSSLYDQCGSRSSYRCVQDNVYSFLDRTLESDIFESDALLFRQNENNYTDLCRRVKKDDPGEYNERLGKKLDSDGGNDGEFQDFIDKVEEVERLDGEMTRRGRDLDDSKQSNDISSPDNAEGHDSNVNDTKSIRDVTDILYNRGLKYLMTHDMELSLPSFVFGGGKVQVSPKGFADDGGVLVKLNVVPDQPQEGRFFFKQLRK
ncbi:Protein of unknown function (DUF1676) [Homalodisca vitripennis]|nr:Protein of unknown function (DUF1676) [Homalodisca vitripennis]